MEFELTESVHVAFSLTKEEISKNVTLPYFNPNSSTTLQTNAYKKGLGAVLLQNSKPVMFVSRALRDVPMHQLKRTCSGKLSMLIAFRHMSISLYKTKI